VIVSLNEDNEKAGLLEEKRKKEKKREKKEKSRKVPKV